MTANYEVILAGSGIGALMAAVGLARQKRWRCLILEQNFNLGGMTQKFVRERRKRSKRTVADALLSIKIL